MTICDTSHKRMQKLPLTHYLIVAVLLSVIIAGCAALGIGGNDDLDDGPRAFFVEPESQMRVDSRFVRVRGSLDEVARLVSMTIEDVMDTTANVLRVPRTQPPEGNLQPFMRVVTPVIRVDSMPQFRQFFNLGDYLLDSVDFEVRAEDFQYQMTAILFLRGQEFLVQFNLEGQNSWNVYDLRGRRPTKVSDSDRVKFGVGSYRYRVPAERVNWRGSVTEIFEWEVVQINDKPTTRGILESELRTRLIELAAINGHAAGLTNR